MGKKVVALENNGSADLRTVV